MGTQMVTDLRIPEGIVVRTAKGGTDSLKGILADLKQYGFTGYVRVTLDKEIMSSIGYLVIEQGIPIMAVYEFEKSKPRELRRIYTGEKSLRFILEDSQDKTSNIELHSRVTSEEFEKRFPDARIAEVPPPQKGLRERVEERLEEKAEEAEKEEEVEEPEEEGGESKQDIIEAWRRKGFKVDTLEAAMKKGEAALAKELSSFEQDTQKLRQFEVIINNFPVLGHEKEVEEIRAKLGDRTRIAEIESDIEFLQEKIRRRIQRRKAEEASIKQEMEKKKRDEKSGDVYDLILKYQGGAEEKPEKKCPRCGGELDQDGKCSRCSEGEAPKVAYAKPLPPSMTFDNFVVGAGSKFPVAAALSVSKNPSTAYNPLLIFGGSGLGKTHLLSAIGHRIMENNESTRTVYIPADKFVDAVDQTKDDRLRRSMREDLKKIDLLLVDDMQFLAASEIAQFEMAQVIEHLIDSGKQVVLASDRLPAQIPGLSDRLSSRIMMGLTADIQPPDMDTRLEILKVKAKEKNLKLSEEIVRYIAERVTTNVRELENALTKIVAFSTIMKLDIDLNLVSDILKPLAPVQETRKEIMKEVKALPGHCYLIEEERPMYSNVLLSRKMDEGCSGLVITRMNPKRIRDEFKVEPKILWLTDKESSQEETIPPSLEMLIHVIQEFVRTEKNGIVVLDGIQYLVSNTNFEALLRFLRSLVDEISESNAILVVSLSPETMKQQELSILEREMEVLNLT